MRLTDLLARAQVQAEGNVPEALEITNISADSRRITPGALFVAIRGGKADGAQFMHAAVQHGAAAVLGEEAQALPVPFLHSANPRLALSKLAAAFAGAQPPHIAAVTGTDGKTSVAHFFREIGKRLGFDSASVGTLGVVRGDLWETGSHTTPDPVTLHQNLARLAGQGVTHLAMEASSHGLDQFRLDGVKLEAAAMTVMARDHLDYHQTMEAYQNAKLRLFRELLPATGTAVLNADDNAYDAFAAACRARKLRILTYGKEGKDARIRSVLPNAGGQRIACAFMDEEASFHTPLIGEFQIYNIMAAALLMVGCGGDPKKILATLPELPPVRGRLELAAVTKQGARVFIDYAHTPAALEKLLKTLRPHVTGKLSVVFGCGGERDPGKRIEMGKVAAREADRIVVTDDNPRSEDPTLIRSAVLEGCPGAEEIGDRKEAIRHALAALEKGDILAVAGKGHETEQIVGKEHLPFDDLKIVKEMAG